MVQLNGACAGGVQLRVIGFFRKFITIIYSLLVGAGGVGAAIAGALPLLLLLIEIIGIIDRLVRCW